MKLFFAGIFAVVALVVGAVALLPKQNNPIAGDPNIVSMAGLHWHPQLEIYVKGETIDIPQNIGIGAEYHGKPGYGAGNMAMTPIHTHEDLPIIHLEFQGVVRKDDITLGKFFDVWSKDMRSFGANMRMTVNGVENTEYADYIMRDGDQIELRYD